MQAPCTRRTLLLGLGGLLAAGCVGPAPRAMPQTGQAVVFDAPGLAIRGRYHPPADGAVARRLWVVIEGDGAAWPQGLPPQDPTPRHPAGPGLIAVLPANDARLYLARPCHYLTPAALAACDRHYWTSARFSAPVLAAYRAVVAQYAFDHPVILVGFSGGGVLAAELALSYKNVAGLITLAAPLDLDAWTTHHGVPAVVTARGSARRLHDLARLQIPTLYLFGARDSVVPPAMLHRTGMILPKNSVQIVPGLRHSGNWAAVLAPIAARAPW
ncbi:hypothetical protein [Pseudorhodobacter sp.]|uniref:hypothetical protein n=1 Tax=Pseudorhodobacter sp. TaxID=1934400 RepID=UPI002AFE699A|nr:hypothetical protein [Pseudorhodobacter sp.]